MFNHFDEANQFIQETMVRMIDLKFCDLWGRFHHLFYSGGRCAPHLW